MIKNKYRGSDMVAGMVEITWICGASVAALAKNQDELQKWNDRLRRLLASIQTDRI